LRNKLLKTTHTLDDVTILFLRYYSSSDSGQENQSAAIRKIVRNMMKRLNITEADLERWDADLCH